MSSLLNNMTFVNKNHELARRCAAAGIPVIPRKEAPLFDVVSTTDAEQIDQWWNDHPDYGVAVCPPDGIYIVSTPRDYHSGPAFPNTICFNSDKNLRRGE